MSGDPVGGRKGWRDCGRWTRKRRAVIFVVALALGAISSLYILSPWLAVGAVRSRMSGVGTVLSLMSPERTGLLLESAILSESDPDIHTRLVGYVIQNPSVQYLPALASIAATEWEVVLHMDADNVLHHLYEEHGWLDNRERMEHLLLNIAKDSKGKEVRAAPSLMLSWDTFMQKGVMHLVWPLPYCA